MLGDQRDETRHRCTRTATETVLAVTLGALASPSLPLPSSLSLRWLRPRVRLLVAVPRVMATSRRAAGFSQEAADPGGAEPDHPDFPTGFRRVLPIFQQLLTPKFNYVQDIIKSYYASKLHLNTEKLELLR